jgi:fructosamine-3-kinase
VTARLPPLAGARRVAGGDINDAWTGTLPDGRRAFVKTRDGAAPGEYAAEAAGLRWLAEGGALVPEVLAVDDAWLALAWLEPSPLGARGEEELGRRLALVHRAGADRFGATPHDGPLRLGALVLPNDPPGGRPVSSARPYAPSGARRACSAHPDAPSGDWPAFYAERRLLPLVEPAGLTAAGACAVEAVCARIGDLAGPAEPVARLHGDLWSGNVHASGGRPYLIDPAAHGGHREVDLAMLALFGTVSARTLAAYEDVWPLAAGWQDRVALWQLFPLLVHAALFGGAYVASAERLARRYA